jgi:hypothetical protein
MQITYFHIWDWLGVDKKDRRDLVPVRRTVPPMTERRGLVANLSEDVPLERRAALGDGTKKNHAKPVQLD